MAVVAAVRLMSAYIVPVLVAACLSGCGRQTAAVADAPAVPVAAVEEREVSEFLVDGKTAATQSVEIRPAVTGYIIAQQFKNGAAVKKGDVLFEIDPRPFQADLDRAEAELSRAEAARQMAETELARATELRAKSALSAQDFDTKATAALEAKAGAAAARAARDTAKLDLGFASVVAPINGLIGQPAVSVGSLVTQDPRQSAMAVIRTLDPIHVRADIDEMQLLNFLRARAAQPEGADAAKIAMRLPDEEDYPHEGVIDFADSAIDPETGKFSVWGLFPNTELIIAAGQSVRLRLPAGSPVKVLLVPQDAVATDAAGTFVRVVNADGVVETRRVSAGAWQDDGTRIVTGPLRSGENVIVGPTAAVQSGQRVQTVPAR